VRKSPDYLSRNAVLQTEEPEMKTYDDIMVIPAPQRLRRLTGEFVLTPHTKILTEPENEAVAEIGMRLAGLLSKATGYQIVSDTSSQPEAPKGTIFLTTKSDKHYGGEEGYEMEVVPKAVTIRASTAVGVSHAVQSLRQLLPPEIESGKPVDRPSPWSMPAVRIKDDPRYRWRGLLLDSCRHFSGKDFILKTLDLLAYHKMNRLHWHLTEDQGWRIQIDKYPKLTEIGAYRTDSNGRRYGGFYTKDDIREIVSYAETRGITIVPEIEMPGHCIAALAAYPDLSCTGKSIPVATKWGIFDDVFCAGNDSVFEFLGDVLSEVVELFPGPYIHIGGDEVPPTRWRACNRCRKRVEDENLKDFGQLQCYFFNRVTKMLTALGRKTIGWDEVLCDDLAPSAAVQVWRDMEHVSTAARLGHDVVVSPNSHVYFDYDLEKIDVERVYGFEPLPKKLPAAAKKRILGGECMMWTEHAPRDRIESKLYPRIVAFAERLWSPEKIPFENFLYRLQTHYKRLKLLGVDYGSESADTRE
jgi:hexosaminidase